MPRKLIRKYTDKGTLNLQPKSSIWDSLIDPYELFETDNPALKKIVEAQKTFRGLTEKQFYAALPEIVRRVCEHFGITGKEKVEYTVHGTYTGRRLKRNDSKTKKEVAMSELKMVKIVFADSSDLWHFVTFNSGEHETEAVADRHDIDIEVMVSGAEKLENVEKVARDKVKRFIKALAETL